MESDRVKLFDEYVIQRSNRPIIDENDVSYTNKHKIWAPTGRYQQPKLYSIPATSYQIYDYLRANIVRGPGSSKVWDMLYNDFYQGRHLLVCSKSQRSIAEGMGWNRKKIYRGIKPLIELEIIKTDSIDVDNYKKQTVYILGTTNLNGNERYYIDVFVNENNKK